MTVASIAQRIISFAYFTIVARMIGVQGTGKYFLALSFSTLFVIFVDLGLTNVLVREAAKAKDRMQEYLSAVFALKIGLGVISYAGMFFAANALGYESELRHMIYLSGVTMLFDSLHLTMYGALRAIGDLRFEAGSIIASQTITMTLGTMFLFLGYPIIFLILAFTIASACNAVFAATMLWKKHRLFLLPKWNTGIIRGIASIAVPFAIAAVLARIYSYADSILLSKLAGQEAVGWYSIPYKMTFAFQFIPLALVAAVYPRFSEYFAANKERLAKLFEQSMVYVLLAALPIAAGIGILAKDIVVLLYTDVYLPSVVPLQILIVSLIFAFASFPIGALLNACDKQKYQTAIVATVLFVNVGLNIILIPAHGAVGAAVAALVGNILLAGLGFCVVPSITPISHARLASMGGRLLLAAGVMGLVVWQVNATTHVLVAIAAGAAIYPTMLFWTRVITVQEMREAWALVKR